MWVADFGPSYIWKFTVGNTTGRIVANTAAYRSIAIYVDSNETTFFHAKRRYDAV